MASRRAKPKLKRPRRRRGYTGDDSTYGARTRPTALLIAHPRSRSSPRTRARHAGCCQSAIKGQGPRRQGGRRRPRRSRRWYRVASMTARHKLMMQTCAALDTSWMHCQAQQLRHRAAQVRCRIQRFARRVSRPTLDGWHLARLPDSTGAPDRTGRQP